MIDLGRAEPETFWQGGWILADTTSSLWPEVQELLLPAAPMDITRPNHNAYEDRVGKVLGYPVPRYPRSHDHNNLSYTDETERQALVKIFGKHEDEVAVTGLEY